MGIFETGWIWWAVALAVAVPVAFVVLTEAVGALERRGHAAAKPLRFLRSWVVPVAAVLGLAAFAFQAPAEQVWVRVVATVLGFLLILLVLSAFNVALFAEAKAGSWRDRVPTIFVEIARLVLVIVGLAVLFHFVWGADVGGVLTALGVGSIVIGLALQNSIGAVISGLLVLFEQPFKIGDWIDLGGTRGRIVEVNWRATHIDTGAGIQVVPNATLAGASFVNLSRPSGEHHVTTTVTFTTDDPPHDAIALLLDVAEALPTRPHGERATAEYQGDAGYLVTLPIDGPAVASQTLSLYLAWLWYAARRRGLALDGDGSDPIQEPAYLERAIEVVAPTLQLDDDDRELVRTTASLQRFGTGEVVLRQGVVPDAVLFVVDGHARLGVDVQGGRVEIGTAEPGDYVGQSTITRESSPTTVVAADVLTVLVMPLATIDELVQRNRLIAEEVGRVIEQRRTLAREAIEQLGADRRIGRADAA